MIVDSVSVLHNVQSSVVIMNTYIVVMNIYICDRPREKGPFVVARINGEIDKIHEISVISRFFKHITGG